MNTLRRPRLTNLTAGLLIAFAGLVTFGSGLANGFVGDDYSQVVNNVALRSLANIPQFFAGSTFYHGSVHLGGVYYRPLMTTAFALLHALAGAQPYWYHLAQTLLYIGAVYLLFLLYREFLRPGLALVLSLVFLVHPMNSQAVYSVSNLQEPLYFGFGVLGLWLLAHFRQRSHWFSVAAALCLLASLLSKETGLCFVAIAPLYVAMFNRRRMAEVAGAAALAVAAYLALKLPAVGLLKNPADAPIDRLGLLARLLNLPALWSFYLGKMLFPWHIAHAYYWVVRAPDTYHFWLPLGLILVAAAALVAAGWAVSERSRRAGRVYVFFATWLVIGLAFHSQIYPLDLTAVLTWFMLPLAGLLGMAGALVQTFVLDLLLIPRWRRLAVAISVVVVALLAARTAVRGPDWSGTYTLAARDLAVSADDFPSANLLADLDNSHGDYNAALPLARQSVAVFPTPVNLDTLAEAEAGLRQCAAAERDFARSLAMADTTFARRDRASARAACSAVQTSVK